MSDGVLYEKRGKFAYITLNRPTKKNAFNDEMYKKVPELLHKINNDESVVFTVFTGAGDFFCSGTELSVDKANPEKLANRRVPIYADMVTELIEHNKILIGFVNGPCVGIGCTILTLFDIIVASDTAYFWAPFSRLGLSPEGTSTYSYLTCMGRLQANRVLLLSERISSSEAVSLGLATYVVPAEKFERRCDQLVDDLNKLAPGTMLQSKALLMNCGERQRLRHCHAEEVLALERKYKGEELYEYVIKSIQARKAKL